MSTESNASIVLAKLIAHLKANHTLHNMSSSLPKADDYQAFLGRGEDVIDALAKSCGIDYHSMLDFEKNIQSKENVFVPKVYLESLMQNSSNEKLVQALVSYTGIRVNITRMKDSALNFIKVDDEEMLAKTPFFHYEVWQYPNYWRARVLYPNGTEIKKIGPRKITSKNEAISLCNDHYLSLLNKANDELIESPGCERCESLEDNPSPCCDMGHCQPMESYEGIGNCIHCGGEMHEINGAWYHHSQISENNLGEPQYISFADVMQEIDPRLTKEE